MHIIVIFARAFTHLSSSSSGGGAAGAVSGTQRKKCRRLDIDRRFHI
jgi:hypothetical protein